MDTNNLTFIDETDGEFEQRLKDFDVQKEKQLKETFLRLDQKFPLEERIKALDEAHEKDQEQKYVEELKKEYGIDPNEEPLVFSLTDLLNKQFPPEEWLVEKLIPSHGLVALSGLPGSFKSWITQHLALSVATGTPLFNTFPTKPGKVLLIDKENQPSLIQKRFKLLGGLEELPIYFLRKEFFIENDELMNKICTLIQSQGIKLLIIDSLIRIYNKKDENSSNDMAQVFKQLRKFQDSGASVIFVHHHRKQSVFAKNVSSEAMRGSSDILASVDSHLAIDVIDKEIRISQPKLRQEEAVKPFKIKLENSNEVCQFVYLGEADEEKEKALEARDDILQTLDEGEVSRSDLIERFKGIYGSKTIDQALKLLDSGEVVIRIAERGKKYYHKSGKEGGELFDSD